MRSFYLIIFLLYSLSLFSQDVWVNGYYKSNGTYVEGYYRTRPNNTNSDNFSTKGNVNPYTGRTGTISSDGGYPYQKRVNNSYENKYNKSVKNSFSGAVENKDRFSSSKENKSQKSNENETSFLEDLWSGIASILFLGFFVFLLITGFLEMFK